MEPESSGESSNRAQIVTKLCVGDRIVFFSDNGPEYGVVKWLGHLPGIGTNSEVAGIEFDNPIGTGNGKYGDKQLFKAKYKHASLAPIFGLMKEEDFWDKPSNTKVSVLDVGSSECAICLDRVRDSVLCPCHHMVACNDYARLLLQRKDGCPICRENIKEVIKVYQT